MTRNRVTSNVMRPGITSGGIKKLAYNVDQIISKKIYNRKRKLNLFDIRLFKNKRTTFQSLTQDTTTHNPEVA